jgi:hypothetical protein
VLRNLRRGVTKEAASALQRNRLRYIRCPASLT